MARKSSVAKWLRWVLGVLLGLLIALEARFGLWTKKLHWRVFWLLPQLIPHPRRSGRSYWQDRNRKKNEQTRVPEAQELRIAMLWGVELYGPAEIGSLYAGLKKLGWRSVGEGKSIQDWIQHQRAFGHGGCLNVGHVLSRADRDKHFMIRNCSKLPDGVSALIVRCHQITPSLTGVLIGFELNESTARSYEGELNRSRATLFKRGDRFSISYWEPEHQKRASVDEARSRLRRIAEEWFEQNLPGFFCSLQRQETLPTMELLMVNEGFLLNDIEKSSLETFFSWRRLVANVSPLSVWSCAETPGLQLTLSQFRDDANGLHVTLTLDKSKVTEHEMKSWGGKTVHAIANKLNEELQGLLIHASTIQYLKEQSRDIKLTRVALKEARSGLRGVPRTLEEIGRYFDRTIGSPAITRELAKKSEGAGWYRGEFPRFTMPKIGNGGEPLELSDEIQASVHQLAIRVNEDEALMRAHIEQISSILSIRESIKTQRRMEWLTIIAVVVAVASLLAAFQSHGN